MIQSESIKELATALAKAQGTMKHAVKDADNPFFRSKYADLQSVVEATRPSMVENGLSVVQITEGNVLWTMLLHTSGEWIKGGIELKPMRQVKDAGWVESRDPQSYGSCITYARRYAMAAITGCATEDDDGNAASGNASPKPFIKMVESKPANPVASPPPATVENQTSAPPAGDGEKKDDTTLRHELQELAAIAEEGGMYPTVSDAIYAWTAYKTKEGKDAGYKDVVKLKGWQMSRAIVAANIALNASSPKQDDDDNSDIPF